MSAREIEAINEVFIAQFKELRSKEEKSKQSGERCRTPRQKGNTPEDAENNQGKLIVDATVAPCHIKYPTDLDLLNDSREISEHIIDVLYATGQFSPKPRTYLRNSRRDYLRIVKKKRKSRKAIRHGIKQQLQYLRRNLTHIDKMLEELKNHPDVLSIRDLKRLEIIRTIFQQQEEMYLSGTHTVKDRIVSIHQPQIRPIVKGKTNADVEFGPKISLSVVDSFLYLDHLRWNAYNESLDLIA